MVFGSLGRLCFKFGHTLFDLFVAELINGAAGVYEMMHHPSGVCNIGVRPWCFGNDEFDTLVDFMIAQLVLPISLGTP